MYETPVWPFATFLHKMSGLPSPLKSKGVVPGAEDAVTKEAVTVAFWFMVTVQVPVPVHPAPDHPVKAEPASADAVRVTDVPEGKVVPLGLVVTEPVPVPLFTMVSVLEEVSAEKATAIVWFAATLLNV
jgi:hypothetical protein